LPGDESRRHDDRRGYRDGDLDDFGNGECSDQRQHRLDAKENTGDDDQPDQPRMAQHDRQPSTRSMGFAFQIVSIAD
jgi:hypothetical protein